MYWVVRETTEGFGITGTYFTDRKDAELFEQLLRNRFPYMRWEIFEEEEPIMHQSLQSAIEEWGL